MLYGINFHYVLVKLESISVKSLNLINQKHLPGYHKQHALELALLLTLQERIPQRQHPSIK